MSALNFALTSPSITDVSDSIALNEARSRFYDAERQGDAALAAWARAYAPPLLELADDAPSEKSVSEDIREAEKERDDLHRAEIQELLDEGEPDFEVVAKMQRDVMDALNRSTPDLKRFRSLWNKLAAMAEKQAAA